MGTNIVSASILFQIEFCFHAFLTCETQMNLEEHNLEFEPEIKFSFEAGGQTLSGPCYAWLNWNQCDKQGCPFEHEWKYGLLNEWTPKQRAQKEWRKANPGKILQLDSSGWPIEEAHQKI